VSNSDLPAAPVVRNDPVTGVPLCEHGDDAAACQLAHPSESASVFSLEPSPAELGETMTVTPGEWTPLDDLGTQIYVYGDQPVDVAVQRADVDDEVRQLHAEVQRLRAELDAIGGMRVIEHSSGRLRVITRALHDRLCRARIATPQEEIDPNILHCAFCGFCYPRERAVSRS
jgi:hypothetical protein